MITNHNNILLSRISVASVHVVACCISSYKDEDVNNPLTQTEKESECILQTLKPRNVSTCDFKNVFFFVFTYQILKIQ